MKNKLQEDDLKQMIGQMMNKMEQLQLTFNNLSNRLHKQQYSNTKNIMESKICCPNGHYEYTTYNQTTLCLKCKKKSVCGKICQQCQYAVCLKCEKINHPQMCSSTKWKWSDFQLALYQDNKSCFSCRRRIFFGKKCLQCDYKICLKCNPLKHDKFCRQMEIIFEEPARIDLCYGCEMSSIMKMHCGFCGIKLCSQCKAINDEE